MGLVGTEKMGTCLLSHLHNQVCISNHLGKQYIFFYDLETLIELPFQVLLNPMSVLDSLTQIDEAHTVLVSGELKERTSSRLSSSHGTHPSLYTFS